MFKVFGVIIGLSLFTASVLPSVFAQSAFPKTPLEFTPKESKPGLITQQLVLIAAVPLSDLWANEIQSNSEVFVSDQSQVGSEVIFTVLVKGLQAKPMPDERIKAEVNLNGKKVEEYSQISNGDGEVYFPFEPVAEGKYEVQFIYDTHERKVRLEKKIYFTITPELSMLWQDKE